MAKIANSLFNTLRATQVLVVYSGNATQTSAEPFELKEYGVKSYAVQRLEVNFSGGRVIIARGMYAGSQEALDLNKFRTARTSAVFDEVWIAPSQQPMGVAEARAIDDIFSNYRSDLLPSTGGDEVDLNSLIAAQLDQLRQVSLEFHEKQLASDAELRARREVDEAALLARTEEARQELERERHALEEYREQINDREPQHERRRLREALTYELREFVKDPPTKASNREWYSNIAYLAAGALFVVISAALTLESALYEQSGSAAFWYAAAKSFAAGLGGAAFIWAGLAGLKTAAKSAREYEQQIQRYSFDMDRASWVVETILQMSATESAKVPEEWLVSVCRDLFSTSHEVREDARSLEALAALLDVTARAKIGTSGFDVELDRKSTKQLRAESG